MRVRQLPAAAALAVTALLTAALTGSFGPAGTGSVAAASAIENFPAETPADTLQAYGGIAKAGEQIGGRIYVGGAFSAVGYGSGTIARSGLVALTATTGQLDAGFNPAINGSVDSLQASADGRYLYVGGTFTSIGGCSACTNLARLDAATGVADRAFHPQPNFSVTRMAASGSRLYIAGEFGTLAGVPHRGLAALNATTGGVDRTFPVTTDDRVRGMNLSVDGRYLYLAGVFSTVGGRPRLRFASVDTRANAVTTWNPGSVVMADGWDATPSPDGRSVYLATANGVRGFFTGYHESVVKVPAIYNGAPAPQWVQAWSPNGLWPTGDVNSLLATGSVVFAGGHFSAVEDGSGRRRHLGAIDAASGHFLPWEPSVNGARGVIFTKLLPAGLLIAGDFDTVGAEARSLFALLPYAGDTSAPSQPVVTGTSDAIDSVTVRWPASLDADDTSLTYTVQRDGQPVGTVTAKATPFLRPTLSFTERALPPGASHAYTVVASDGVNTSASAPVSVAAAANPPRASYLRTVLSDAPSSYWRVGRDDPGVAQDETATGRGGVYLAGGVTFGTPSSLPLDPNPAITFDGTGGFLASASMSYHPTTFSLELRFRTTTTTGGKLIGFGSGRYGSSSSFDRHVYLTNAGRLIFGAFAGRYVTITSPRAYNDGAWHALVATLGPAGMVLYVDGASVGSNPNTGAQPYWGFWKVGADSLTGWPDRPSTDAYTGSVDEVAIYRSQLSPAQVAAHAAAGR